MAFQRWPGLIICAAYLRGLPDFDDVEAEDLRDRARPCHILTGTWRWPFWWSGRIWRRRTVLVRTHHGELDGRDDVQTASGGGGAGREVSCRSDAAI